MRFILLHGRPAAGKLTVARHLAGMTGDRVFDNHLIVDAALAAYDFGTPGFVALRDALWRAAFAEIAARRVAPGLIFTFNPENSVPQRFIDDLFELMAAAQVETHCIALTCPESEIELRLTSVDRGAKKKLVDVALYRRLREAGTFDSPRLPPPDFVVDTGAQSAEQAAAAIAGFIAQATGGVRASK
ncbi:MAG: hypothetical protein KIT16_16220 [Rhodospirillaceae bacterium]|nr:hypothetical protein [Rhodospirillaceae bacterium]